MINLETLAHQKDYERLELTMHQHWMIPLQLSLIGVILAIVPALVSLFIQNFLPGLLTVPSLRVASILVLSAYALMVLIYLFQSFLDYYLDIWVVTNERVISAERISLFHYTMSELRLHQIQDVSADMVGFLPNLFNYGQVRVQTAGELVEFIFENISHPKEVAQKILALADADREYHNGNSANPETPHNLVNKP